MRKLVLGMHAGIVGTNEWEFYLVPDDVTQDQLDAYAWERAVEHAGNYGIEFLSEEDQDEDGIGSNDMEGWFEEYNPEKHDGCTMSGKPDWQDW